MQYLEGQRTARPDATTRRVPAALVLRASGFNLGDRWGPVQLSDKHVLAIVTHDGATADECGEVAHLVSDRVADETGVGLHPEPRFVGEFADPDVAAFTSRHAFAAGPDHDPQWLQR